jgi:hypothetical protein
MRLTVRRRFDFGPDRELVGADLVRPESWDALRLHTSGAFGLPADRAAWEQQAGGAPDLPERAQAILEWMDGVGARSIASYGVGTAMLELHLHRLRNELPLILTDYAPDTVARLSSLFHGAEVRHHDLLRDGPLDADVHLMHRVDSELSDEQWRDMLARFGSVRVLVAATEVASTGRVLRELVLRGSQRHASRAGWLRTQQAFDSLWRPTHHATQVRIGDLWAWDLEPRT